MTQIHTESVIDINQIHVSSIPPFKQADSGFSTESISQSIDDSINTPISPVAKDDISDFKEYVSSDDDDDDEDDWCTIEDIDGDDSWEHIISMEITLAMLSAVNQPDEIETRYKTLKEEILSHKVIYQRNWIRVIRECTKALNVRTNGYPICTAIYIFSLYILSHIHFVCFSSTEQMDIGSDPERPFTVADSGIQMDHLIALKLFTGDYRFGKLQRKLIDCLQHPLHNNQWQSILRWKTTLEEGMLLIKDIRNSLNLKGDVIFTRDISLECLMASVFENKDEDKTQISSP